ncbi:hypothetical protein GCM10018772_11150 [Streptomyces fumanus]|uniref:Uncharacterized protein n=1 Tax=Streptomyces fumanus TaxID=67302 RepID=A0A919A6I9_9ACTN|nr:hypothetical protein GCM10018772_11150 [Streptomyces fumanus]
MPVPVAYFKAATHTATSVEKSTMTRSQSAQTTERDRRVESLAVMIGAPSRCPERRARRSSVDREAALVRG